MTFTVSNNANTESSLAKLGSYELKQISLEEIFLFRRENLHLGMPETISHFQFDGDPSTFHLGCFDLNRLIGVISLINESPPNEERKFEVWRLRGLSVKESYRKRGIGQFLLLQAATLAKKQGAQTLWGDAREINRNFFAKQGAVYKDDFDLPGVAKFCRMTFNLDDLSKLTQE